MQPPQCKAQTATYRELYMPSRLHNNMRPHTRAHELISKSHAKDHTAEECVFPPTQTHNYWLFFPLHNIYAKHMHLCTSGQAQWHSFPSIPLPCTPPLPPLFVSSLAVHLPGLQQGHTPQLPRAHAHTYAQRVREGVR